MANKLEYRDLQNLTSEDWRKFDVFRTKMHNHLDPDDPLLPFEAWKNSLLAQVKNPNSNVDFFFARNGENSIIGQFGLITFDKDTEFYEKNPFLAFVLMELLPDYRKQGTGTEFLIKLYNGMKEKDKKIAISNTQEEDGRKFARAIGAIEALTDCENRLYLEEIDHEMIQEWIKSGEERNPDTKLMYFEKVPDDILDHFAEVVTETFNQAPLGELELEEVITPKNIREKEEEFEELNKTQYILISVEKDGEISGLTRVIYNPANPKFIFQGLTSVREHHRGRGLGKWLKADMLLNIMKKFPTVEIIATGNATSNAPMLSINKRMGFKEYKQRVNLQVQIEDLEKYLKSKERI